MTLYTGADLPELGWQSADPFDPQRWAPIGPGPIPVKPSGGLWTAPINARGTAWTEYCMSYGAPDAPIYRVVPDPGAAVFIIHNVEDLQELERKFPDVEPPWVPMWPRLDWVAAAQAIDAVWLTEYGQHATRFSEPGLYGWDCETVLWLRPSFTIGGWRAPHPDRGELRLR
jgi:hypothetical protein